MHSQSVAQLRVSQQLVPTCIALLTAALSFWFTLQFCRHLWSNENCLVMVAFGVAWECAKLHFGPRGFRGLQAEGPDKLWANLALIGLALVLATGSVAASFAHLSQTDAEQRADHVKRTRAYEYAAAEVQSIDSQIFHLDRALAADVTNDFRKRALVTSGGISALRAQRETLVAELSAMEHGQGNFGQGDIFLRLGALWGDDAAGNGAKIRMTGHIFLAVMLELVGMMAFSLIQSPSAARCTSEIRLEAGSSQSVPPPSSESRGDTAAAHAATANRAAFACALSSSMREVGKAAATTLHRNIGEKTVALEVVRPHLMPQWTANSDRICTSGSHTNKVPAAAGYEQIKELVCANQVAPSFRAIRMAARVGQATAQRYLHELLREGCVRKENGRYRVVGTVRPVIATAPALAIS